MRIGNFTLPGKNHKVNGAFEYDNEGLSGESSGTDSAHKGIKPKTFSVSLLIEYVNDTDLTALVRVAESVDNNGAQTIYDIVDSTINAFNVRRVRFDTSFRASEMDEIQAWDVQFSLTEISSTSEKVESRQELAVTKSVVTTGTELGFNVETGLTSDYEKLLNFTNQQFQS